MKMPQELKKARKQALRQGWNVTEKKNGHLSWKPRNGRDIIVTPSTPSDPRSIKNAVSLLKKAGLGI